MNYGVIDLGYGDTGKGLVTKALSLKLIGKNLGKPMVVRFNGGHQAAHNVWHGKQNHIFHNFGSASLEGVKTYWSEFCTVDPMGLYEEREEINNKFAYDPTIIFSPNCPVTTPFDKIYNINNNLYSSVGVGFGATIEREENFYHLKMNDLMYEKILRERIYEIRDYYRKRLPERVTYSEIYDSQKLIDNFVEKCLDLVDDCLFYDELPEKNNLIFEGAQGLLLDQHYGFFPFVTRSNTGSKNIIELLKNVNHSGLFKPILVTRAYQVRHGLGYMSNENLPWNLKMENEFNERNEHQGNFRKAILDIDMLNYAISQDKYLNHNRRNSILVVTCLDHVQGKFKFTYDNGHLFEYDDDMAFLANISRLTGIPTVVGSSSKYSEDLNINI